MQGYLKKNVFKMTLRGRFLWEHTRTKNLKNVNLVIMAKRIYWGTFEGEIIVYDIIPVEYWITCQRCVE